VFFLRARDYSKSVAVAPFIINYSGALFREYPGPWQVRRCTLCCSLGELLRHNLGKVLQADGSHGMRHNLGWMV
jgi:hypothetical protein